MKPANDDKPNEGYAMSTPSDIDAHNAEAKVETVIERLEDKIDRLEEALQRIETWSQAYPLAIFPEPDLRKAVEVLKANGMTLDAISAHCMRHVVEGVGKIARDALKYD